MQMDMTMSMRLPINLRKWLIERFIQQKENEKQAAESQQRKGRQRSK
jgi:pantothenate kinase